MASNRDNWVNSAVGLIQALGAIFAVIMALILTNSVGARIAIGLALAAAALLVGALVQWTTRRRRSVIQMIAAATLVAGATATYSLTSGDSVVPGAGSLAPAPEPPPILAKQDYPLVTSSSPFTNDQDKIDLDTGCPGWGDMSVRVGPRRCGELADLIVDQEGIHTRDGGPHFHRPAAGRAANLALCSTALGSDPNRNTNLLDAAKLKAADSFCVETDKDNIAVVRIERVTTDELKLLRSLTISFSVWHR